MSCVLYSFCLKRQEGKFLGIHVALIDKSEVIQKMLLHCLYYYTVQVHRFSGLEEYLNHFHNKKPSLIFIDWEVKQGERPLIYTAIEQFHSVPFVLLYRKGVENELSGIPEGQAPYRIKKPINPKEVRDICAELIPELKDSVLHSFLKFPQSAEEKEQEKNKPAPSALSKQKKLETDPEEATKKTKSFIGNLIEKTGLFKMPSPEEIEAAEEFPDSNEEKASSKLNPLVSPNKETGTGLTSVPASPVSKKSKQAPQKSSLSAHSNFVKTTDTTLIDKKTSPVTKTASQNLDSITAQVKEAGSVTQASSKANERDPNSKIMKTEPKTFNKEDIKLDEDTQNDLAPMAIKSSSPSEKKPKPYSFSKQDVLQAFDKYKDSLEFQKLMEKTLAEYAQDVVAGVLKGDSVKSILQQPLADFKESGQFKQLVEKEISQYVQRQLPLVIKSIVENEIKKILGD